MKIVIFIIIQLKYISNITSANEAFDTRIPFMQFAKGQK